MSSNAAVALVKPGSCLRGARRCRREPERATVIVIDVASDEAVTDQRVDQRLRRALADPPDAHSSYWLLRRPKARALSNWITAFMGRNPSYDITAARRDLGYEPVVTVADRLVAMSGL